MGISKFIIFVSMILLSEVSQAGNCAKLANKLLKDNGFGGTFSHPAVIKDEFPQGSESQGYSFYRSSESKSDNEVRILNTGKYISIKPCGMGSSISAKTEIEAVDCAISSISAPGFGCKGGVQVSAKTCISISKNPIAAKIRKNMKVGSGMGLPIDDASLEAFNKLLNKDSLGISKGDEAVVVALCDQYRAFIKSVPNHYCQAGFHLVAGSCYQDGTSAK